MADLMPLELWANTFSNLDGKDLARCMSVNKFFQTLTQDPKLRPTIIRGTVVSTLKSYYKFLTTMYLPEEEVLYPPETGWPNITQKRFAYLEKTDDVIEILRYIPYVRRLHSWEGVSHIYDSTVGVDYRAKRVCHDCPVPEVAVLPPWAITLATPPEADGQYIFLDTHRGTVTLFGTPSGPSGNVTEDIQVSYAFCAFCLSHSNME